jgi:branched-chain amino acid transport system ATP-binding protein
VTPLLTLSSVCAGYDNAAVLFDVSLTVGPAEIVAVIGSNGVGKTTMMRTITGLLPITSGEIIFKGSDLLHVAPYDRPALGLSLSPEGRKVFPNLSVENNLLLGSYNPRARKKRKESLSKVYELFPKLKIRRKQSAGLMSGGEQQMLAIGRALMSVPDLLMLDEPSLGLAPLVVEQMFDIIQKIAKTGVSVLLVEQNAAAALDVAHRGYVVSHGRVIASGPVDHLQSMPAIRESFLAGVH